MKQGYGLFTGRIQEDQPPSGGCVLKRYFSWLVVQNLLPAAFRRLCVETATSRTAGHL